MRYCQQLAHASCRLESERASDRAQMQSLTAKHQQQITSLQAQQQQQVSLLQQQQAVALASMQQQQATAAAGAAAESAATRSSAVGLAGELSNRQSSLLRDMAALAVEIEGYRYLHHPVHHGTGQFHCLTVACCLCRSLGGLTITSCAVYSAPLAAVSQTHCNLLLICRQEASAAGANLHSNVERLNAKLAAESTAIEHLRQGVAATAAQEAAALAGLQGQVGPMLDVHPIVGNLYSAWLIEVRSVYVVV